MFKKEKATFRGQNFCSVDLWRRERSLYIILPLCEGYWLSGTGGRSTEWG